MASKNFRESREFQDRLNAVFLHFLKQERGGRAWLVKKTGFGSGTVSEWFNEESPTLPSQPKLKKIAEVVGISYEWLATGKGTMFGTTVEEARPEYVVDGDALFEAGELVDELVIQGKPHDPKDRLEWVSLVAEEIAELKALGRPDDIRKKVRRWIQAAKRLGGGQSRK